MKNTTPSFDGMPDDAMTLHRWLLTEGRLDLLRNRLKLSEIVGRIVQLDQAEHGEMRAHCPEPDHRDDQKAFFVNDDKGIFHCFGCGVHGDAIRWMTSYADMDYVDAVRLLAHEAGLIAVR